MAKSGIEFLHDISQAVNVACVFIIFIPTLASCGCIDETIIEGAKELNSFDIFHVTSNYTINVKTQLDMMMSINQYMHFYGSATTNRLKRKALMNPDSRWHLGFVVYEIADNIEYARAKIINAINHWQMYTCLKFIETKLLYYGIRFQSGTSCWSYVGNMWHIQELELSPKCINEAIIIHEIGHAVGFIHEHARSNRDLYIKINSAGVPPQITDLFEKLDKDIDDYGIPYDYTSIMHYSGLGFITTLDPAYQKIIGKSPGLSFKDIKLANLMYDCARIRSSCPEKSCPFNGFVFFNEFKGKPQCECFCDSGDISDPLVPCSSITEEAPGPKIIDINAIEKFEANPCFDFRNNCKDLKAQGLCLTELSQMVVQCTKTCNYCNKGQDVCMDHGVGCDLMTSSCENPEMKKKMSSECSKTCKLCSNPADDCQVLRSYNEQISNSASINANFLNMFAVMQIFYMFHVQQQHI